MTLGLYRSMLEGLNQRVGEIAGLLLETFYQQPCVGRDVVQWVEWRTGAPGTCGAIHAHLNRCKWCESPVSIDGLPALPCQPCGAKEDWAGDRYILPFDATYLSLDDNEIIRREHDVRTYRDDRFEYEAAQWMEENPAIPPG